MLSDQEIQLKNYSDFVLRDMMKNGFFLDISGEFTRLIWNNLLKKYNYPLTTDVIWIKRKQDDNQFIYYRLEYVDRWIKMHTTRNFKDICDILLILSEIELFDFQKNESLPLEYLVIKTNDGHLQRCRLRTKSFMVVSTDNTIMVISDHGHIKDLPTKVFDEYFEFRDSKDKHIHAVVFGDEPWDFDSQYFLKKTAPLTIKSIADITEVFLNWTPSLSTIENNGKESQRASVKDLWERREEGPDRSIWKDLRPDTFEDVVGQDLAIANIRASLLSPWKRHLIFTGPPGVGKTTIARLCLDEIRGNGITENAPFIEYDCASSYHDKTNHISGLLGYVQDASYRGASKRAHDTGVPDIKPGIISQAHGGVLFLDEISELPFWVQTALLKILEDGIYKIETAITDEAWTKLHDYEKKLLKEGMPANFLMIGATTQSPEALNPALISRSTVIQFKNLTINEKILGLKKTMSRVGLEVSDAAITNAAINSANLREATGNILCAHGFALVEQKKMIEENHVAQAIATANNRKDIGFRGNR